MRALRQVASRVDDAVFQAERLLLLASLAMMTLLVSVDVIQRTFSRPVGKTASFLLWALGQPAGATRALVVDRVGPGLFYALALLFSVAATQASRSMSSARVKGKAPGWGRSLAVGAGLWAGLVGLVQALLWLFPSSVPGAQKFALGFMLWSGMLGASLATRTRRHIMLDAIKKKVDPGLERPFALVAGLATFAFCAFLAFLGALQVTDQIRDWATLDGVGVYDALPIPLWLATLAIPVTFGTMALRFLALGISDFVWGPKKGGLDAHGIDLEALERQALPGEAPPPDGPGKDRP